jgi:acetyl esterase/lipase
VAPLTAVAFRSIRFDDIFDPDTLEQLRIESRNPYRVLDLFVPETAARPVAFFFIHGGGWHSGCRTGYHRIMRELNRQGYACGSTDYTLQGGILDQLRDVRHGYDLFCRILAEQGRPVRVVVHGASAGAHLALLLALAAPGECGEPLDFESYRLDPAACTRPAAVAVQSAPVTLEKGHNLQEKSIVRIVGVPYDENPAAYRRVSPNAYIRPGAPPIFHQASDRENFFPVALFEEFAAALRACGGRVEQKVYAAEHGFLYDVVRPEQREALADLIAFAESVA